MCATCGCGGPMSAAAHGHEFEPDHEHAHGHDHEHPHEHDHEHPHEHDAIGARLLRLEHDLLAKNDAVAGRNRGWLRRRGVLALNLLSAPGSGKTTLLERTTVALAPAPVSVLEGDQETSRDAERVRAAGAKAVQVNTGTGCHLDAAMVERALATLEPPARSHLFIENVGNLVCPALFDLGERAKVVLLSVTEGEDKPLKYPHAFRAARALVVTKIDLLPHVTFDLERCLSYARAVSPHLQVFALSARSGEGLGAWYDWLRTELAEAQATGS
jgi:hydrogenase nickel incorporation protein HypB